MRQKNPSPALKAKARSMGLGTGNRAHDQQERLLRHMLMPGRAPGPDYQGRIGGNSTRILDVTTQVQRLNLRGIFQLPDWLDCVSLGEVAVWLVCSASATPWSNPNRGREGKREKREKEGNLRPTSLASAFISFSVLIQYGVFLDLRSSVVTVANINTRLSLSLSL